MTGVECARLPGIPVKVTVSFSPGVPGEWVTLDPPPPQAWRLLSSPFNAAFRILVTGPRVQVMTSEANIDIPLADWALYDLFGGFVPQSVSFSDHYWLDHQRLSAEGKIRHSIEACPERFKPLRVREWGPESGWRNIALPPIAANDADSALGLLPHRQAGR